MREQEEKQVSVLSPAQAARRFCRASLVWLCLAAGAFAQAPGSAQSDLDQAYALLRAEKLGQALLAFQQVLERDPANRTARLELGYLNGRLGRWAETVLHLGSVSREERHNLKLRMDYGYALEHSDALEQAATEFQAVAELPGEFQAQAQAALEALRARLAAAAERAKLDRIMRRDTAMNRGYAELRAGNAGAAREAFEQALAEDPENVTALKQLAFLALQERNPALAVRRFEAARQFAPKDHTLALDLGYLYERMNQPEKAEKLFAAAAESPDQRTRGIAEGALRSLRLNSLSRVYLEIYVAPLFSTRFSNAIAQFQGQLHWRPRPPVPLSLYLGTRVTRDSRSRGGELPAIFSDNVVLFGVGVQWRPPRTRLSLLAEVNLAGNLTQSPVRIRDLEPDYRAALLYYRRWESRLYGPVGAVTLGRLHGERLFTDLDASLGYYSRYDDNLIGYLQLREGLHLGDWGPARFYGYGKLNLVKDSNRDFYNNLGEIGAGLESRPSRDLNLSVRLEYLRGIYYGIEGRDRNPFQPQYNDFRVTLLLGHRIVLR